MGTCFPPRPLFFAAAAATIPSPFFALPGVEKADETIRLSGTRTVRHAPRAVLHLGAKKQIFLAFVCYTQGYE